MIESKRAVSRGAERGAGVGTRVLKVIYMPDIYAPQAVGEEGMRKKNTHTHTHHIHLDAALSSLSLFFMCGAYSLFICGGSCVMWAASCSLAKR